MQHTERVAARAGRDAARTQRHTAHTRTNRRTHTAADADGAHKTPTPRSVCCSQPASNPRIRLKTCVSAAAQTHAGAAHGGATHSRPQRRQHARTHALLFDGAASGAGGAWRSARVSPERPSARSTDVLAFAAAPLRAPRRGGWGSTRGVGAQKRTVRDTHERAAAAAEAAGRPAAPWRWGATQPQTFYCVHITPEWRAALAAHTNHITAPGGGGGGGVTTTHERADTHTHPARTRATRRARTQPTCARPLSSTPAGRL
jgi:hypothetical protein